MPELSVGATGFATGIAGTGKGSDRRRSAIQGDLPNAYRFRFLQLIMDTGKKTENLVPEI
jgi:hypothetical protein